MTRQHFHVWRKWNGSLRQMIHRERLQKSLSDFVIKIIFSFSSDFVYEQFTCGKAGRQEATKDTQVTQSNEPRYEADEFVSIAIAGDNWEGENAIKSMSRVAFIITFRTPNRLCNVPIICRAQLENYSYCIRLGQKYHDKNVYFIKEQLFALWQ